MGSADLEDCVLIGNDATNGGAAYATSTTTLTRCNIAEGSAPQQGAAVYSAGATIEVKDSRVHGFSANASGGATTIMYIVASVAHFDRITWSNNELDAVRSTDDATVMVRNNEGLIAADVQAAVLLGCDDANINFYCSLAATCTDAATGITCYCHPDGAKTDPKLGACDSSGEMSSLVVGAEATQLLSLKKDDGIATTSLFFPNTGDVFIVWGLAVTKNPEGLNWTASSTSGTLEAGGVQRIMLSLDLTGMQARKLEYSTELTLNSSSPTPTPIPIFDSTTVVVRVVVSASANAITSVVTMTNLAVLTAAGALEFVVDSVDAAGVPMLDVSDVVYVGELSAESGDGITGVITCSIIYSVTADHHVGTCVMPGLATGGFALKVLLGSEMVGGSAHLFTVDRCPGSYVLDDGGGSCTCAAGQYELAGASCVVCADNHAKPSLGTDKADCVKCETVIGETSNAAHTACDACIAGYYNKGHACVRCPNYPDPCVDSSVLMPGYWRAAGDDDSEVLECPFGDASCPGAGQNQAVGRDQYCAAQYIGPLCSVCAAKHFLTSSQNECAQCNRSGPWLPTIMTGSVVVLCIALVAGACIKTGMKEKLSRSYKIGKTKGMMLVVVGQVTPTS